MSLFNTKRGLRHRHIEIYSADVSGITDVVNAKFVTKLTSDPLWISFENTLRSAPTPNTAAPAKVQIWVVHPDGGERLFLTSFETRALDYNMGDNSFFEFPAGTKIYITLDSNGETTAPTAGSFVIRYW